jgi:tRNA1(Val) A37 N6-methylase TrmN6
LILDLEPGETLDSVRNGELLLVQRRSGYRFSVDAMLLASWAGRLSGKVVDLGTGCGVIPLLLASRGARSIVGVELQAPLYRLAARNVALNHLEDQIEIIQADLRELKGILPAGRISTVLSNPPYVASRSGHVNPMYEKAIARHELTCSLPELAAAARHLLKNGGSFKLIFPARRLVELLGVLERFALTPKRMRLVYPVPSRPAKMVLMESTKGGGDVLQVLPPLYLYDEAGAATREAQEILVGGSARSDR